MILLPNEPRLPENSPQHRLTERHLQPSIEDIAALMRALRAHLDPMLARSQPTKHGKPYPKGQCLEITRAVQQALPQLDRSPLTGAAARAWAALTRFRRDGGEIRQVWGVLREQYFQNALLVGSLYVDVANDTVDTAKPPVEILPLAEARLVPVRDYAHFAHIAATYWEARVYPNHILPALAAWFPLVAVTPGGSPRLQVGNDYMLALNGRSRFQAARQALQQGDMPEALQQQITSALADTPHACDVRHDPDQARRQCHELARLNAHLDPSRRNDAVTRYLAINERLGNLAD